MSKTIAKNCFRRFGCEYAAAVAANNGEHMNAPGSLAAAYSHQRHNAIYRSVDWRITFPEWARVWMESGKWALRGRVAGSYCMSRDNDTGPYAAWNVSIQPIEINNSAARALAVIDIAANGRKRRGKGKGWTLDMRQPNKPFVVRCGDKYVGCFATQPEAEAAYAAAV